MMSNGTPTVNDHRPPLVHHTSTPTQTATVGDALALLASRYPESTAMSWDAVGLVCGDRSAPLRRIHFAVDPVAEVIDEAVEAGASLLVVHHPLFLRGVHGVSTDTFKGEVVHKLITAGCALYVAHTNADTARPGVSDALARVLGLDDLEPLDAAPGPALDKIVTFVPRDARDAVVAALSDAGAGAIGDYSRCAFMTPGTGTFLPGAGANPTVGSVGEIEHVAEDRVEMVLPPGRRRDVVAALRRAHPYEEPAFDLLSMAELPGDTGIGRVGTLPRESTLEEFAGLVARALPYTVQGVRVAGPASGTVRRVAVCGGSGDSLFNAVRRSGADVFVTGDLRHHPTSEFREEAGDGPPYLIDVAHWASEWPWLHHCGSALVTSLTNRGFAVDYAVSTLRTDPWTFRVPSSGGLVR